MDAFLVRDRTAREAAETVLSPAATRSAHSRGRQRPEEPDPLRTAFERDRDRILHSKAFRRLKHKTQVFLDPEGDHYVTRLTHTLQVTQVARALSAGLSLNEPLAEAIALAHDVGHSPFGHTGEDALSPYFEHGWYHGDQGVRTYEVLEDANLTWEVRDGVRAHTWRITPPPHTAEGLVVRFADRIAYLTHDALDALRAGLLRPADLPAAVVDGFGPPGSSWIGTMVTAVIEASARTGSVTMEAQTLAVMHELRDFLFARVYQAEHGQAQKSAAADVIRRLVDHHLVHPDLVPRAFLETDADRLTQVVDYVAGMTDRYALAVHEQLFGPVPALARLR